MAWNPSPEVAVARDAAVEMGHIVKSPVVQIVVLFVTENAKMGYASYGRDRLACGEARKLGDRLYKEALEFFGEDDHGVEHSGAERQADSMTTDLEVMP